MFKPHVRERDDFHWKKDGGVKGFYNVFREERINVPVSADDTQMSDKGTREEPEK